MVLELDKLSDFGKGACLMPIATISESDSLLKTVWGFPRLIDENCIQT